MPSIEIVSHPLCPHAQRLVLIGIMAGRQDELAVTYLAYPTLPQTAPQHSETGELPVLKLDGTAVSSSTDDAAGYLDRVFGLNLLPDAPEARLRVQTAERRVNAALDALRSVYTVRDQAGLETALAGFFGSLARIERHLDGANPSALADLGDVALAPLASLTGQYPALRDYAGWQALPKLSARMDAARADPRVANARCPHYAAEFDAFFALTGSAFPTLAAAR